MKKAICLVLVVLVLLFAMAISGYARDGGGGHSYGGGGHYYGGGGHYYGGGSRYYGGRYYGGHYYGGYYYGGGVWIGPGWGGWGPWGWGYPYYPYNSYYPDTSVIVQQQPQAYVQPSPQPAEQYYWYFCTNPQGYYPYVKRCPNGWLKVIPPTSPDDEQ